MKMHIAHFGRTGKDSSITFDTEEKVYYKGRNSHRVNHDVYIYAERTGDVDSVVMELKQLGYKEACIKDLSDTKSA